MQYLWAGPNLGHLFKWAGMYWASDLFLGLFSIRRRKFRLLEDQLGRIFREIGRVATPRHVLFAELPEEDRFRMLGMKGKYFIDTIKLIAYRAETAMVNIARQIMRRHDDARSLLRSLYATEADILADHNEKKLTVRLHQPANRCSGIPIPSCRNVEQHLNGNGKGAC